VRAEQLPQERRELVGHVRGLLAELPQQDADIVLIDAKVRGQVLGASHPGTVARRGLAHSQFGHVTPERSWARLELAASPP
jgi:hypothetical protein